MKRLNQCLSALILLICTQCIIATLSHHARHPSRKPDDIACHPLEKAQIDMYNLLAAIQPYTAFINETVASLNPGSAMDPKIAGRNSAGAAMQAITVAIRATRASVSSIRKKPCADLSEDSAKVANAVFMNLLELTCTLDALFGVYGTSRFSHRQFEGFFIPMVAALSGLLFKLEALVGDLPDQLAALQSGCPPGVSVNQVLSGVVHRYIPVETSSH